MTDASDSLYGESTSKNQFSTVVSSMSQDQLMAALRYIIEKDRPLAREAISHGIATYPSYPAPR